MSDYDADIVIVGAGITGAMVARTLIENGGDPVWRLHLRDRNQLRIAGFPA